MNTLNTVILINSLKPQTRQLTGILRRTFSTNFPPEIQRQNEIFNSEKKRQRESIGRIEKIEVKYEGGPEETTLVMNKNISTAFDVAKHMGEKLASNSALALLNKTTIWHMHKPLPDSCSVELLQYTMPEPYHVNKAFWRTCSFLLGAVAANAFKDKVSVNLHSFPAPNVRSGSFVYDVQLSLDDWQPTQSELKVLSIEMIKFCQRNLPLEILDVSIDLAQDIFRENQHKFQQIPDIAAHNNGKITLFRAGEHIDISKGPMVTNSNQLGRITVANVIKLEGVDLPGGPLYRFQGIALPRTIILNHFSYGLLEERARQLNSARIPNTQENIIDEDSFVAHVTQ